MSLYAIVCRMSAFARAIRDLAHRFGPQGWWPRVIRSEKLFIVAHHPERYPTWFSRTIADQAFEVAVGAILTQNTMWSNVEKALLCLAERDLLASRAIASCHVSILERCIRSSGYFRQKAKKLKRFAQFIEDDLRGDLHHLLERGDSRHALLTQWGIGPETADTILLYGVNQPFFVVDTYTRRFLAALYQDPRWLTTSYEELRAHCEAALSRSVSGYQEAHALIVAWGKQTPRSLAFQVLND